MTANQPLTSRGYRIGLPQWNHEHWYAPDVHKNDALSVYSTHFTSVEGNNSFYGLPSESSISQWREQAPDGFSFCFKFPREISHDKQLLGCAESVSAFLNRVAPLEDKLGVLWLQLSAQFSPKQLDDLQRFLSSLPNQFNYAVEVRHLGFFDKSQHEQQFNRLLIQHNINRVIFDTRSLFAHPVHDAETQDALRKKPQVPTHVIATGKQPMVRFISPLDTALSHEYLGPWVKKVVQWIDEGREPYIFFHTPSNDAAPQLAQWFSKKVQAARPSSAPLSLWRSEPLQESLW